MYVFLILATLHHFKLTKEPKINVCVCVCVLGSVNMCNEILLHLILKWIQAYTKFYYSTK